MKPIWQNMVSTGKNFAHPSECLPTTNEYIENFFLPGDTRDMIEENLFNYGEEFDID